MCELQVKSLDEAAVHLASLSARIRSLELQHHHLFEMVDTLWTPPWKKLWFWVDGWPLYRVVEQRKRRPWHRGH